MTERKEIVRNLIKSIETGDPAPASHINSTKYTQHNLGVEDGLEGFGKVLSKLPKGSAKANAVRVFADGDYVFAHTDYNFFGPKVGFDIFRFQDGKIVEHWDNLAEKAEKPNPSNRTQLDGPMQVADLHSTHVNKKHVSEFIDTVLIKRGYDKLPNYVSTQTYLQHNTMIGDGLSGLQQGLAEMAKQGISMEYERLHKILGEGNFVLSVSEGRFAGKHVSFYDLFRLEDGKIVEHWDVIEEIPSKEKWANHNGKF